MPEARDRRVTSPDVTTIFTNRRASIFEDSNSLLISPAPVTTGLDRFVAQRTPIAGGVFRARALNAPGSQNTPPATARRGRNRGSRSILPAWYPRTPLRDITSVVRAIERRRGRIGNEEITQTGTPQFSAEPLTIFSDPSSFSASSSSRAVKNSPKSVGVKLRTPYGSKVPKILIDIATLPEEDGESELLTPQKKLLNSIDKVEMAVTQELMKLKRTPSAKKAEREKRVRTLMSMR